MTGKIKLDKTDVLVVIDVQKDFCAGGSLAVQNYEDQDYYNNKDLGILSRISEQAALAISHKHTEESLKESKNLLG